MGSPGLLCKLHAVSLLSVRAAVGAVAARWHAGCVVLLLALAGWGCVVGHGGLEVGVLIRGIERSSLHHSSASLVVVQVQEAGPVVPCEQRSGASPYL